VTYHKVDPRREVGLLGEGKGFCMHVDKLSIIIEEGSSCGKNCENGGDRQGNYGA